MNPQKTGILISKLRKENNLTQAEFADKLNISNKTVSKWETGLGLPDISLWADLSDIFKVDMYQLMEGDIVENRPDSGNINKIKFYVCSKCSNIIVSTGDSSSFCCGKKLEALEPTWDLEKDNLSYNVMDLDYYVEIDHPMTKENYILFAALVKNEKYYFQRLYPEQSPNFRLPYYKYGTLYLYSLSKGLGRMRFK